jgi:hypothetical protein
MLCCCFQVSEDTYRLIGPLQTDFKLRESVEVKGKGLMRTFVLREHVANDLVERNTW